MARVSWEYKIIASGRGKSITEAMNELGAEGWEAFAIETQNTDIISSLQTYIWLRRSYEYHSGSGV